MGHISEPNEHDMMNIKLLARYFLEYPECAWKYEYQEKPTAVSVLTDSDWAGDEVDRTSVDCVHEYFGNTCGIHLLLHTL